MRDKVFGLVLACVIAPIGSTASAAVADLSVSIDADSFLVGEPIYYVATVRNLEGEPIRNLGSLLPDYGSLSLVLLREDTNEAPKPDWLLDAIPRAAGPTLPPGASFSDTRNLNWYFGLPDGDPSSFRSVLHQKGLTPGKYRFRLTFKLRSNFDAGESGPSQVLSSNWVSFEVSPIASSPSEARLVDEFLADPRWKTDGIRLREEICEDWLARFADSPHLASVYSGMGTRVAKIQAEDLYQWMSGHKVPPKQRTRLVQIFVLGNEDKWRRDRTWLGAVRRLAGSRAESLVVERALARP